MTSLSPADARLLRMLASTRSGRTMWPLSDAVGIEPHLADLEAAGLAQRCRVGGYPGARVTDKGREMAR